MSWCEHLDKAEKFYNRHLDPYCLVFKGEYWQFCPICGKPRPEKPKSLAEKLYEKHRNTPHAELKDSCHSFDAFWNELADIAKEHFFGDGNELLIEICRIAWDSYGGAPADRVAKLKDYLKERAL